MVHCSNTLLAIINVLTFLLSIPISGAGIWLATRGGTECEKLLQITLIVLGSFIMLISLIGFRGACYRSSGLLCFYLFMMLLLIACLFCFTMFALAVTNQGAGEALAGKGYKEYRLHDYSNWLKRRISDDKNWVKLKSCLAASKVCTSFADKHVNKTVEKFYSEHLPGIQSGCCKPPAECKFTYVQPTVWNKDNGVFNNPDCQKWVNNPDTLCYNCQSCQTGLLDQLKDDWKKAAEFNIAIVVVLTFVFMIGCCASGDTSSDPRRQIPYAPNPYPPNPYVHSPHPPNHYQTDPHAYKHMNH